MATECNEAEISDYEFGLVCVDKSGYPVKHLFGKGSFDPEESFDTLIKCEECLGLEKVPDSVALAGEVATMANDIADMKAMAKNISVNVDMLNSAVFKPGPSPAPAVGGPPSPAVLVHTSATHHSHLFEHARNRRKQQQQLRNAPERHRHHHRPIPVRYDDEDYDDTSVNDDSDDRQEHDSEEEQKQEPLYEGWDDDEDALSE